MNRSEAPASGKVILDAQGVAEKLDGLTRAIASEFSSQKEGVAIVGIQTRGVILARRLASRLKEAWGIEVPVGTLDITLYRDDVHAIAEQPEVKETDLPFDIEDRSIVLVDDVLFTGRTVRSAMNALIDYGRPICLRLAILVDRGHHELPIRADYVGLEVSTRRTDIIDLNLEEMDHEDTVRLRRRKNEVVE